jgi:ribosomal protein L11 methyltransferase
MRESPNSRSAPRPGWTGEDRWYVLTARTPSRDLEALVAEGLFALGAGGVEEVEEGLVAYLPPPIDAESYLSEVRARLSAGLPPDTPLELSWTWKPNEDWAALWKRGLEPRRITDRIVVKPTWTEWEPEPGQIVLGLDPQMAFGTGEHATTRGCLRLLDAAVRMGDRVLDVGSGSGILSIAAVRLGASEVVAIENDPDANLNAGDNLRVNGVHRGVTIVEADADPHLLRELGPFDLIVANILSGVILPLLPTFRAVLRPDGRLIVSGILRPERTVVTFEAERCGFEIRCVDEEEEWWSALLVDRAPAQNQPEESDGGEDDLQPNH